MEHVICFDVFCEVNHCEHCGRYDTEVLFICNNDLFANYETLWEEFGDWDTLLSEEFAKYKTLLETLEQHESGRAVLERAITENVRYLKRAALEQGNAENVRLLKEYIPRQKKYSGEDALERIEKAKDIVKEEHYHDIKAALSKDGTYIWWDD